MGRRPLLYADGRRAIHRAAARPTLLSWAERTRPDAAILDYLEDLRG